jgi:hypothetical protein
MLSKGDLNIEKIKTAKSSIPFYGLFILSILSLAQNTSVLIEYGFYDGETILNQAASVCFDLFVLVFSYIKFYKKETHTRITT